MTSVPAILLLIGSGRPSVLAILLLAGAGAVLWSREHPPPGQSRRREVTSRSGCCSGRSDCSAPTGSIGAGRCSASWTGSKAVRSGGASLSDAWSAWCWPPPWGPVGPMAALTAVALGSAVVLGFGFVHFGLTANPWNWALLVILAALVMGSIVAVSVLLRRPGVGRLGLLGGLFVAATWLAFSRVHVGGRHQPHQFGWRLVRPRIVDRGAIGRGGG